MQEALKENMLCPFHYFDILEIEVDGQIIDEMTRFNDLVSKVRVDHIIEKINHYVVTARTSFIQDGLEYLKARGASPMLPICELLFCS